MEHKTWHLVDKSKWADGPWKEEPDKEQWTDDETGFACLIVRNHVGALCGYVGVPDGHPWHGVSYRDLNVRVHGDLNFSRACAGDPEGHSICHVAAPGEPEPLWWLGFDCGHAFDIAPLTLTLLGSGFSRMFEMQTYKTIDYVKAHCALLALEVKNAAPAV